MFVCLAVFRRYFCLFVFLSICFCSFFLGLCVCSFASIWFSHSFCLYVRRYLPLHLGVFLFFFCFSFSFFFFFSIFSTLLFPIALRRIEIQSSPVTAKIFTNPLKTNWIPPSVSLLIIPFLLSASLSFTLSASLSLSLSCLSLSPRLRYLHATGAGARSATHRVSGGKA